MKHILTSLALLATFAAAGQTANPFPYNPDADADGWISVNDLLSLLSIFTTEFTPIIQGLQTTASKGCLLQN